MITPTVTPLIRRLEPVSRDPFLDGDVCATAMDGFGRCDGQGDGVRHRRIAARPSAVRTTRAITRRVGG